MQLSQPFLGLAVAVLIFQFVLSREKIFSNLLLLLKIILFLVNFYKNAYNNLYSMLCLIRIILAVPFVQISLKIVERFEEHLFVAPVLGLICW